MQIWGSEKLGSFNSLYETIIVEDFIYSGAEHAVGFSEIPEAFTVFSKVQINLYKLSEIILCILKIYK